MADPGESRPIRIQRFTRSQRVQHLLLMVSFLALALSGLPLLFAEERWAQNMVGWMGGYAVSGAIHRMAATLLIGVFCFHLAHLLFRVFIRRERGILWGPDSLVPQPRDAVQMAQHVGWFVGRTPRPRFERYTYWEKFDYWAVFWGMGIIGGSGLLMWFPQWFSGFLPGWVFNVALMIHGEEALLAMVFIFTVHFFNGHLRPEKFPMDTVIFTGQVDSDEVRRERPGEYARLEASGALSRELEPESPPRWVRTWGPAAGAAAVVLGLILVLLTLRALLGS